MLKSFQDSKVQTIGALVIIAVAIVLGLTQWKLPGAKVTNTHSVNTNTTMGTYSYPGKLPDAEITNQQATIKMASGDVVFSLDAAQSPIAVSNFIYLAKQHYYDGIKWHRVESWVVQAGDPQTKNPSIPSGQWGTGGPGYTIPDEQVTGSYDVGVVAMAKTAAPNSAGSQFFIMKQAQALDPTYQILGKVTAGMDLVNQLTVGDTIQSITIAPAA